MSNGFWNIQAEATGRFGLTRDMFKRFLNKSDKIIWINELRNEMPFLSSWCIAYVDRITRIFEMRTSFCCLPHWPWRYINANANTSSYMCNLTDIPSNPATVFTFKFFVLLYVLEAMENTETNANTQQNETRHSNGLVAAMLWSRIW
jgi:hypothetical protein